MHHRSITDYYLNLLFYLIKDLNINNDICFEVWRVAHVSICNRPALYIDSDNGINIIISFFIYILLASLRSYYT